MNELDTIKEIRFLLMKFNGRYFINDNNQILQLIEIEDNIKYMTFRFKDYFMNGEFLENRKYHSVKHLFDILLEMNKYYLGTLEEAKMKKSEEFI